MAAPLCADTVPGAHIMHSVAPNEGACHPGTHGTHVLMPSEDHVPGGHGVHTDEPLPAEPAAQGEHP